MKLIILLFSIISGNVFANSYCLNKEKIFKISDRINHVRNENFEDFDLILFGSSNIKMIHKGTESSTTTLRINDEHYIEIYHNVYCEDKVEEIIL